MRVTQLSPDFSVSDQIAPQDLALLAAQGFRAVICNRPDGEGPGQPAFATIAAAARAAGMEAAYLPVVPGMAGPDEVRAFADLLTRLPLPALAYCRSGARAQSLWSMSRSAHAR